MPKIGRAVWLLTVAKLVLHLVTARGYGIFRDELYYLACGERLAFGYVDHPPLVAMITRLFRLVLGDSLLAIRVWPALAGAATVLTTGMLCAELGGGTPAQVLACVCALVAPIYLGLHHFNSMNAIEQDLRLPPAQRAHRAYLATHEEFPLTHAITRNR